MDKKTSIRRGEDEPAGQPPWRGCDWVVPAPRRIDMGASIITEMEKPFIIEALSGGATETRAAAQPAQP